MRCHYISVKGVGRVLVPGCMAVAVSNDISRCTCHNTTYLGFEREEYNKEVARLKNVIKKLEYENEYLTQLLEDNEIWYQIPKKSGSAIHVAVDGTYRGYIMISDSIRENAFEALEEMRSLGASTLVMLTGDVRSTARTLASSMNFDMVKPELNPEEKGSAIRYLRSAHGEKARIACVGDGYHDTEMFREADISVCLEPQSNGGHADINVFSNDITRIPLALRISRRTELTLLIHAAGIAGLKIFLAVLGAVSVLQSGVIAGLDCAFGIAAVIHALTCLTLEKRKG